MIVSYFDLKPDSRVKAALIRFDFIAIRIIAISRQWVRGRPLIWFKRPRDTFSGLLAWRVDDITTKLRQYADSYGTGTLAGVIAAVCGAPLQET
jgi:hypothetical protein